MTTTKTDLAIPVRMGVEGFYTVQRRASNGDLIETIGPFKNAITNIGLERIGTATAGNTAYYGTGTTPASILDTQMGAQTGYTSGIIDSVFTRTTSSPYWAQHAVTFRFSPAGVNQNLTEVGVGWFDSSTNALWSRALIVDGSNNPVTLTLLSGEFLDVTYSLRYYPPLTDSSYSATISGVSYSFVTRLADAASSPSVNAVSFVTGSISNLGVVNGPVSLGPVTGTLSYGGEFGFITVASKQAYVPGTRIATYSSTTSLAQGNVTGGIAGLVGTNAGGSFGCGFQTSVTPPIPKDNTKTLTLSFSISWDRY